MNNEDYKIPIPLGCSKNAIIYQRLSSTQPNQYNLGKDSLDSQKNICEKFCQSNGLVIKYSKMEIGSAYNNNLEGIKFCIKKLDKGDILVVCEISRFSRNILLSSKLLEQITKKNCFIYAIKENVWYYNNFDNTHRPENTTFINYIVQAQTEAANTSTRIRRSIEFRRNRGDTFGRPRYGMKIVRTNGIRKFVHDEDECKIISLIMELLNKNKNPREIADNLNQLGIFYRNHKEFDYHKVYYIIKKEQQTLSVKNVIKIFDKTFSQDVTKMAQSAIKLTGKKRSLENTSESMNTDRDVYRLRNLKRVYYN